MEQRPIAGAIAILVVVLLVAFLRKRGKRNATPGVSAPPPSSVTDQLLGLLSFTTPRPTQHSDSMVDPFRSESADLAWQDELEEPPLRSKRIDRRAVPTEQVRLSTRGRTLVVGGWYWPNALSLVADGRTAIPAAGDWARAGREDAFLVGDPSNRFDHSAVKVFMRAGPEMVAVGFLSSDAAEEWQPLVREIEDEGCVAVARCALYRSSGMPGEFQVVLHLGRPEGARFQNDLGGAVIIDGDRDCAVTQDELHQDAIQPYTNASGPVWATLHGTTIERGKMHGGQLAIEVRIDGRAVGVLTHEDSRRYGHVLDEVKAVAVQADLIRHADRWKVSLLMPGRATK